MNYKRKIYLNNSFKKLENNSFDENDIRLLLIEIRELLDNESFLKEVCHFIAHPDRDKGICHSRINSRHAKMKFSKEGMENLKKNGVFENNKDKSWEFFSEKILSYINTNKIEKKLFEIIIKEGIEEIDDEMFLKFYKISKTEVKNFVLKFYKIEKGFYILKTEISEKEYKLLDDLLKFIRGTITGKSAFNQKDLETELLQGIERISNNEKLTINIEMIKESFESIVVCIISILHEANFILFDNSIAKSYLTLTKVNPTEKGETLYLSLHANADNFSFPIISTKINSEKYINETYEELENYENEKIPWIIAMRESEKLKLIKTNA